MNHKCKAYIKVISPSKAKVIANNLQVVGGGGTSDYTDLRNLPQINEVELIGNKTGSELGLVDKVTEVTNTPQVYAKNKDGSQGMLNAVQYYSDDRNGLVRYINGNIVVNTPTEGGHATTKNYVDDKFVAKQNPEFDAGATRGYVYYIEREFNSERGEYDIVQTVKKVQIQANPDTIVLRNPNGTFYVGNATLPYEAVNKAYVDGLVSNLSAATVIRLPKGV